MQNTKQVPEPIIYVPAKYEYKKSCYAEIFQVLQSFRKDEVFCDIKLETDDGGSIFGHKVVLASASPYFHGIFTNFKENNQDIVVIKKLDSKALQILVEFIYSGQVTVTEKNVQVLLPAANLLQLEEVKEACCDFLQAQLCLTNCIDIFALADLHSCLKLLSSSKLYIQQHFSDVVEGDTFLSLSSEQITKLIASEELKVPSEEKVFESAIRWVKHDLNSRKQILPQLMKHVRLPLTSKDYILKHVVTEPLLNNCPKCKDYVIEALHFYLLKSDEIITVSDNIRTKPRQTAGTHKVIIVVGGDGTGGVLNSIEWYDPKIIKWQLGPKMSTPRTGGCLAVVNDNFVMYMGGRGKTSTLQSADLLDLSSESPSWKPTTNMLVKRRYFGVGVINNYIYAVGGMNDDWQTTKSVEVFDCRSQKWRMVSSMSTCRSYVGVGVLNNLLYAIGGFDGKSQQRLKTGECYDPSLDKWTPIAEMCVGRSCVGVGVLDDVLYAVGGYDGQNVLRSVEAYRPSTGVWTTVADMHLCRQKAGVAVLDGLLYVVGGYDGACLASVECYNPNTNKWTMITASMNVARFCAGVVVIEKPRHLKKWCQSYFLFLIEYIDIYSIYLIAAFCIIVSIFFFYLFSSFRLF